jgi:hypothetical protein
MEGFFAEERAAQDSLEAASAHILRVKSLAGQKSAYDVSKVFAGVQPGDAISYRAG